MAMTAGVVIVWCAATAELVRDLGSTRLPSLPFTEHPAMANAPSIADASENRKNIVVPMLFSVPTVDNPCQYSASDAVRMINLSRQVVALPFLIAPAHKVERSPIKAALVP
jgi:hypothetical protein